MAYFSELSVKGEFFASQTWKKMKFPQVGFENADHDVHIGAKARITAWKKRLKIRSSRRYLIAGHLF